VDCISLVNVSGERTGWNAWSAEAAQAARESYAFHRRRLEREHAEHEEWLEAKATTALADLPGTSRLTDPKALEAKRAVLEAALARIRERKATL
jgi:electron transport complex protein RnfB